MAKKSAKKLREFESKIAAKEGKKKQVSIGNIREVLSVIENIFAEEMLETAMQNDCNISCGLCSGISESAKEILWRANRKAIEIFRKRKKMTKKSGKK